MSLHHLRHLMVLAAAALLLTVIQLRQGPGGTENVLAASPAALPWQPLTSTGAITSGDPSHTNFLNFAAGGPSTCGPTPSCPGVLTDPNTYHYDTYLVTNSSGSPVCYTVTVNAGGCGGGSSGLASYAFLGSFNPASLCTNYAGGFNSQISTSAGSYSVTVPAGQTLVVVVEEYVAGAGCASYTVDISPASSPTPTATPTSTATPPTIPGGCSAQAIGTFSGSIVTGDPTFQRPNAFTQGGSCSTSSTGAGVHYDVYEFQALSPATIMASLCAAGGGAANFDSFVAVYQAPGGAQQPGFVPDACSGALAANDDFCGSASQVTASVAAGYFYVVVTQYATSSSLCTGGLCYGDYTLALNQLACATVTPTATPTLNITAAATSTPTTTATPTVTPTQCPGQDLGTFNGAIDPSDPTYQRPNTFSQGGSCSTSSTGAGVHYDVYEFQALAPATITASLCAAGGGAANFDSFVAVYQAAGGAQQPGFVPDACKSALAANDDFCGSASQVSAAVVAGYYYVVVTQYSTSTAQCTGGLCYGDYTLAVSQIVCGGVTTATPTVTSTATATSTSTTTGTPTLTATPISTPTPTPTASSTPPLTSTVTPTTPSMTTSTPTRTPVPGPVKPAAWRNGTWYLRNSLTNGPADLIFMYGLATDVPLMCDWDGNGSKTPGVFRKGGWYLRNSNTTGIADITLSYGLPSDTPICGDWDGDGVETVGVIRGTAWYLRNSNTSGSADVSFLYGQLGDRWIVGDWDSNGTDTPGAFRDGSFYLRNSNSSGLADLVFMYGLGTGDGPLAGDWNGDG
ncbi:MAG: hypothetical protein KIT87_14525, partial [Anaerolineae bacterium]|nr:hypothetical protein [Anaerolineae bacterium]